MTRPRFSTSFIEKRGLSCLEENTLRCASDRYFGKAYTQGEHTTEKPLKT